MDKRDIRINIGRSEDSGGDSDTNAEAKVTADQSRESEELARLSADLNELRNTMMRRQADFENYKKRIEKERSEDSQRATARLVESLIPVIDGFEHALAAHREAEYESYRKGFELIYKQLLENLKRLGIERLEPLGEHFDPHLHQGMDRTETKDAEDGTILQVFQPGYVYRGRVLRPAMVRVAANPGAASKQAVN